MRTLVNPALMMLVQLEPAPSLTSETVTPGHEDLDFRTNSDPQPRPAGLPDQD